MLKGKHTEETTDLTQEIKSSTIHGIHQKECIALGEMADSLLADMIKDGGQFFF